MSKGFAHPPNLDKRRTEVVMCFNIVWIDYQGFVVMRNQQPAVRKFYRHHHKAACTGKKIQIFY